MGLLEDTIKSIRGQDDDMRGKAKARLGQLTMPYWALGRLLDLAVDLAGITGSMNPPVAGKTVVVMAGDHGVTEEGVSRYPSEVTIQMIQNILAGGAGINAIASAASADVIVADMGSRGKSGFSGRRFISRNMGAGTGNIAKGPAMSREKAVQCLEAGIEIALNLKKADVFGTGEMGIGNTTPSSAITAVITGCPVSEVTGHGTGIDNEQMRNKINIIERAISVNQPDKNDGLDVLAKIGGFEIGGIAGLILGAASIRKPVLIDGFISTAGALIAYKLCPASADYMIASHRSVERGHHAALDYLKKKPLFDLDLRLGEGTGAALAMPIVDAAVNVLTKVATFDEAGVSEADK